jgi:hypothetical protein
MAFGANFETKDLISYVDMFTKFSASLTNLVESGVSSNENVRLCSDVIDTMQEVLNYMRGLPTIKPVIKAAPKRKAKK